MKRTVMNDKPGRETDPQMATTALSFDAEYPQPPERVWKALTDAKALARWFLPGDFEPRMGFRFQFEMGRRRVRGEVIAADRERRLAYTWRAGDEPETVVTWTMEPTDAGGTRVHLEHTEAAGMTMSAGGAGWSWGHIALRALPRILAAGAGRRGMRVCARSGRVVLTARSPRVQVLSGGKSLATGKFLSIKGRISR